jgi:exodeoxyribonuclease-3
VAVLIATWNVNSLKARLPRVQQWVLENKPDVLCIQETKMKDAVFPSLVFHEMGYESAHFGQGQWNGVAILSKVGLDNVINNFFVGEPDGEARIISATCNGTKVVCVYVPNGRELDHDHYQYKLRWMKQLKDHVASIAQSADDVVVTGDFNIAPDDIDVWDPEALVGSTHVSKPEREVLNDLCAWGLTDVYRQQHPEPKLFSWWDYRDGGFHKNHGMRIDLLLASASVANRTTMTVIDRNARKGEKPSDQAPVVMQF